MSLKGPKQRPFIILGLIWCIVLIPSGLVAKKQKGRKISGYLWATNVTPAVGKVVSLIHKPSGKTIQTDKSNFLGYFGFKNLDPGAYIVQVGNHNRLVHLSDKNIKVHIHMKKKDGRVDFVASAQENTKRNQKKKAQTPPQNPVDKEKISSPGVNNKEMARWIAGEYYSYEGSTERTLILCPNGTFFDSRESSYSGTSTDSLGNQTSSFGGVSQSNSSGMWSIQGNKGAGSITFSYRGKGVQTVKYHAVDKGCFKINGITFCYKAAPRCN